MRLAHRSLVFATVSIACLAGTAMAEPTQRTKLIRHPAGEAIANQYLVVLNGAPPHTLSAGERADATATIDRLAATHGAVVHHRYAAALRGFAARMTEAQAEALAADPAVAQVEADTIARVSGSIQNNATWGLDRIDQATLPLDSRYVRLGDGEGATVFVIDTGLRQSHVEFAGRVVPGATAINDGQGTNDCHGHGTHVAGTAAGATLGVAKNAKVVPVRVFDCTGAGAVSNVIAGIDYVAANHPPRSVANLSLGGAANATQDQAIRNLIATGVTVVVAAGNDSTDACTKSPARTAEAITVAASSETDARAGFSNYGTCVDLHAPGTAIVSAGIANDTATLALNGTSMASPHVAGAAAAYLSAHPTATPAQVTSALLGAATLNKVTDAMGSPSRLLNTRFLDTAAPATAITSPADSSIVPTTFTVTANVTDPNLASVELAIDGTVLGAATSLPIELQVQNVAVGSHTLSIIATDLAGQSSEATVAITVSKDAPPEPGDDDDGGDVGGGSAGPSTEVLGGCSAGRGGMAALPVVLLGVLVLARRRRASARLAAIACVLAACTMGEEAPPPGDDPGTYVDTDGDGTTDGLDTDGDGDADFGVPSCPTCTPGDVPSVCLDPIVDADSDGVPEGIDLDCDGVIDIPLDLGGGPDNGGGSNLSCISTVINNGTKKSVACTSDGGGTTSCECKIDDQLVSSCTTTSSSACSVGYPGANCCGF